MSPLTRIPIAPALPPFALVPRIARLAPGARVHAIDAGGPEGWRTPPGGSDAGASLLGAGPELTAEGGSEALLELQRWLRPSGERPPDAATGFVSLAYDLGREFERLPESNPALPEPPVRVVGFRAVYVFDPANGHGEIRGSDARACTHLAELVSAAIHDGSPRSLPCLRTPVPRTADAEYRASVERILEWIAQGDVYQVNLSRRLEIDDVDAAMAPLLYEALTRRSGAPFSAFFDQGDAQIVSNSPERFLRIEGRQTETCPIKGTRPRGRTPEEDRWLAKELASSAKDRAEHLMIVDLERNDLGRVCETGSVRVARLGELRSYANVHHLVSSVRGELRDPADWRAWLAATFPGGSITGAPKLRAMEIIEELEPVRRGVYTGALGVFDAAGGVDLSIAIRTAVCRAGSLTLHLGGGIVADSDSEDELRETREKGRAFAQLWAPRRS